MLVWRRARRTSPVVLAISKPTSVAELIVAGAGQAQGSFQLDDHPDGRHGWSTPCGSDCKHRRVQDSSRWSFRFQQGWLVGNPGGEVPSGWESGGNHHQEQHTGRIEHDGCLQPDLIMRLSGNKVVLSCCSLL